VGQSYNIVSELGVLFLDKVYLALTDLVIVESPTKTKTLRKFLGRGYRVRATMGHVRDLPPKELGVAIEEGFKPKYHLLPRARKTLQALREAIEKCDRVILATDPDREGEAIAWHVVEACQKQLRGKPVYRARFHEITEGAVTNALDDLQSLDMHLVNAQQARRVVDRLVGYQVSPVLWQGISGPPGLSAGRVQSVALRQVVERDREIEAFQPTEYWTLAADLARPHQPSFIAELYRVAGKKPDLKSQVDTQAIVEALKGSDWRVANISQQKRRRQPYPPYITSTLQRDASVRLRWSAKKVMQIAQQLYEGVNLEEEGHTGLITYMRTDSTAVSQPAQAAARTIIQRFYPDALPAYPPKYAKKVKNAQEAHEAIRPTDPARFPKQIRAALTSDQDKLYTLIWRRFIASQMTPAIHHVTTVNIATAKEGKTLPYLFRATGRQMLSPGFLQVYEVQEENAEGEAAENKTLPPLATGDELICHKLIPQQHFTKPPPHFSDAALIQAMEKGGIGRPSTFANIVDTLYRRKYVLKVKGKLQSTELGRVVCDFLVQHFHKVFEVDFTARMEDQLDDIANGEANWQSVMAEMWAPLAEQVTRAEAAAASRPKIKVMSDPTQRQAGRKTKGQPKPLRKVKASAIPIGRNCAKCGQPLVERKSKYGAFVGCSGFPQCRYKEPIPSQ
jgi:DNA topoisomerase-1